MGRSVAAPLAHDVAPVTQRSRPRGLRRTTSGGLRWLRDLPLAAIALAAAAALAAGWAHSAHAGTVLMSRDSVIHTVGGPGPSAFNLTNGTTDFGRFANDVNNDAGGSSSSPATGEAHQYSVPGVTAGLFQGAFAEGSVQTTINSPGGTAGAQSQFDLTFRVIGSPQSYTFGAAMGTAGGGTALAELVPLTVNAASATSSSHSSGPAPIFSTHLQPGDSKTIDQSGLLGPGTYALRVHADTSSSTVDASAYFSVNLTLGSSATAVPLPAGAWTGMGVLIAVCTVTGLRQWGGSRRSA